MSRKIAAWSTLVLLMSVANYAFRFSGGEPRKDVFFRYETAASALVQYGVIFGVVCAIAAGAQRELFALGKPRSWGQAAAAALLVLLLVYAAAAATSPFLDPGGEQGLAPTTWDERREAAFVLNALVVVLAAPVVEELMFRGVGFALLRPLGVWVAVLVTGAGFAATHGLVEGFPLLFLFGAGLAWIRERTGSVLPCMLLHGSFNALALVAALAS
jgi:uncharacterized protein